MEIINSLWNETINYGYRTRKSKSDGLIRWNELKVLIPNIKLEWTDKSKTFYNILVSLGVNDSESSKDANMDHTEWERHHYLLQHGRIIKNNEEGSLVRLLQIAYNIGQFNAEFEKKVYPENQMKFYREEKMNELLTYYKVNGKMIHFDDTKLKEKLQMGGKKKTKKINKRTDKKSIDSFLKDYLSKL
jgi:hypothetical protein